MQPICVGCGSIFQKEHLLCEWCFSQKIRARVNLKLSHQIKDHYYLIDWLPQESDFLSNYVYCLKGIKAQKAWQAFADLTPWLGQFDMVVPIPGSRESSKHSFFLAQALARKAKTPMVPLLKRNKEKLAQKNKNRRDRQSSALLLDEQFTIEEFIGHKVLLVDDILTTGSSMKNAIKVLNGMGPVTLFTLFYRQEKSSL